MYKFQTTKGKNRLRKKIPPKKGEKIMKRNRSEQIESTEQHDRKELKCNSNHNQYK